MTAVTDKPTEQFTLPETDEGTTRFVAIRVNLMPDEIVAGRRTEVLRRRVLMSLGGLVAVLVALFAFSWWQTHGADSDLDAAKQAQTQLQAQQQRYAPLVQAQSTTQTIDSQLKLLMVGDVPWRSMLNTLRQTAPSGVSLTSIDGSISVGAAAAGTSGTNPTDYSALDPSGSQSVGSLTLTGTAHTKKSIADYADALGKVTGLGNPFISNVATADGKTTFTISVQLTQDALGGRYATTGGK